MGAFRSIAIFALRCAVSAIAIDPAVYGADAATTDSAPLEEVVVTGYFKRSIEESAKLKQNSSVIADAISAEDVGKFPDANVADALQRITGVQISHDKGGEGRFVSIRGLGSTFNLTTFNGRIIATDNSGRDFSYDVLPSEVLNSAIVYKTQQASMLDGSIGGMVSLTTIDPTDHPGLHVATSAQALYDESTSSPTPRLTGVVSDTFLDDKLGAFVGAFYYKRKWAENTYQQLASSTESTDATPGHPGTGWLNDRASFDRGAFPGITSYQIKQGPRERTSIVTGVTFAPNERVKTKLDAFFSRYYTPENSISYNQNFFTNGGWGRFTNGTVVPWGPGPDDRSGAKNEYLFTHLDFTGVPVEAGTDTSFRDVKMFETGWNTVFKATDKLTLTYDASYSRADSPNPGKNIYTVLGLPDTITKANAIRAGAVYDPNQPTVATFSYDAVNPAATVTCLLTNGQPCLSADPTQLALHFMRGLGDSIRDHVFSTRLDGDYRFHAPFDLESYLKVGGYYSDRMKSKMDYNSNNGCATCQNFQYTLGSILGSNVGSAFVSFPGVGYTAGRIVPSGYPNQWPALNANEIFYNAARLHFQQQMGVAAGNAYYDANLLPTWQPRNSSIINEKQYGSYLQFDIDGKSWYGNLGVRYVRTDQTTDGWTQQVTSLTPIPGSTNFAVTFSPAVPVTVENRYDDLLPSANFIYRIADNLLLRAAASKSITRPNYSQLGLDINWEANSLPLRATQNGNPNLRPVRSNNADLSLEWYGKSGDAASVAAFYKDVKGYITTGKVNVDVLGHTFVVTEPVNNDTAQLSGLEVAYQKTLQNGLGALFNFTYVDNKASVTTVDNAGKRVQIATELDGVSKYTYNGSAFYEKYGLSMRLSYVYRGKFTSAGIGGPHNSSITTAGQGFLDFAASYDFRKYYSVFLNAYNLTQEVSHTYVYDTRYTPYFEQYPRRYEAGLRVRF